MGGGSERESEHNRASSFNIGCNFPGHNIVQCTISPYFNQIPVEAEAYLEMILAQ